jgi:hypothetical protein
VRRPYVKVYLFAMDMRQLELHMVAGHEDPVPTTGSAGTGRIPRRPDLLPRIVAAFNGAFKSEHGEYGMMVERNVLLPPKDGAATIATMEDGRVLMGSWPDELPIPDGMVSYRQNMDPLVEDGVVNPRRRYLWGFTLSEDITEMNTIRSGVCLTERGHLVYARGEDLTADTLGIAMNAAGCAYGIHLDMNPFHTAYIYYRFREYAGSGRPEYEGVVALRDMRYSEHRYINGAPKDFFFLALRDPKPPGDGWRTDRLAQPAPAFLPAVFRRVGEQTTLVAFDASRIGTRLVSGEIPSRLIPAAALPECEETADVLASISLGRWSSTRGQLVAGAVASPLLFERASLAVDATERLLLGSWPVGEDPVDAVQGEWLLPGTPPAYPVVALGRIGDDWIVIGRGPGRRLASELKELGVEQAVMFSTDDPGDLAVRTETGMENASSEPLESRAPGCALLEILARPRPIRAERLQTALREEPDE